MFKLLYAIILCIPFFCQAQSLTVKSGTESKTFDPETYYEFSFGDKDSDCCNTTVLGMVTRVFEDSIQVRLNNISMYNKDLDFLTNLEVNMEEQNLLYKLPKSELLQLVPYKSRKQKKNKSNFQGVGGALLITGLVTLANSYSFKRNEFRNGVLYSSAAQIGVGVTILSLTTKKRYDLVEKWSF